jgi:surface protein
MSNRRALGVRRVPSIPFIISVTTDNSGDSLDTQFTIPTEILSTYNYTVRTSEETFTNVTGDQTLTWASAGTYDVEISGIFPQILFNGLGDKDKLTDIKQWGDITWNSFASSFAECLSLTTVSATDVPNLSNVSQFSTAFAQCPFTTIDVSGWDASSFTNIRRAFSGCTNLTSLNLTNWDVSNVSTFSGFLADSSDITTIGNVSGWDVSNVSNMEYVFQQCNLLTGLDFSSWNVSSVTSFRNFLWNVDSFDNDLSGWDIDQVTEFANFMLQADGLSTANYDSTLISWANQTPTSGININFGGSQYTLGGAAEAARTTLTTTYLWTITDGGGI